MLVCLYVVESPLCNSTWLGITFISVLILPSLTNNLTMSCLTFLRFSRLSCNSCWSIVPVERSAISDSNPPGFFILNQNVLPLLCVANTPIMALSYVSGDIMLGSPQATGLLLLEVTFNSYVNSFGDDTSNGANSDGADISTTLPSIFILPAVVPFGL